MHAKKEKQMHAKNRNTSMRKKNMQVKNKSTCMQKRKAHACEKEKKTHVKKKNRCMWRSTFIPTSECQSNWTPKCENCIIGLILEMKRSQLLLHHRTLMSPYSYFKQHNHLISNKQVCGYISFIHICSACLTIFRSVSFLIWYLTRNAFKQFFLSVMSFFL